MMMSSCHFLALLSVFCGGKLVGGFSVGQQTFFQPKESATCLHVQQDDILTEYSRSLYSPSQERAQIDSEYTPLYDEGSQWRRRLLRPIKALHRKVSPSTHPGTLILIKSGESKWKNDARFTGWANPRLTPNGEQECRHAARLLLEAGYEPDLIYTSMLQRAMDSVWIINQEMDSVFLPAYKSWRLNERHYGSVQGVRKKDAALEFGKDVVQAWRRSFKARPPPLTKSDPSFPGNDRRYAGIDAELLPCTESLQDCMQRQQPLWTYKIKRKLQQGETVLVVGHSNSLRGLVKIIDNVPDQEIENVHFLPGVPVVYKFDKYMNPIAPTDDEDELRVQKHTSGVFLEKPGLLEQALKRQTEWQQSVPGAAGLELAKRVKRMTTMEESLLLLKREQEMATTGTATPSTTTTTTITTTTTSSSNPSVAAVDYDDEGFEEPTHRIDTKVIPNVGQVDAKKDPVVVLVRHGTTPHNELALFTGWEDPPLAEAGVEDAKRAGRLLKRHNFEFDVCYTSWLGRAIETAWHILGEMDMQWIPMVKSWRLNERHYGKLTGRSKKMVGNLYGQDQLKRWRRGFDIPPPKASSYSHAYPGNDARRTKYVKDLRISWTETICRSIEARELQIHRKFPKSESLKMCMARSIPYYTEKIVPEAVEQGKRVLITSHENAIRGILMHLCEIPPEHMNDLHLPNGLPLIYNVRRKCISLLDDGTGRDPMEVHDFGSSAQYLFRPCELTDEDFAAMEETITTAIQQDKKEEQQQVEQDQPEPQNSTIVSS